MHRTLLASAMLLCAGSALWGQAKPTAAPALQWGPAPAVFPPGAQMAVVSGDPSKAEQFAVQLKMPDGYTIPPHFHPTAELVEVKSGTFLYGMGDAVKAAAMKAMAVGQSVNIPATMHHYAGAKGATVIQVSGMGPFVLTYVNPADDPQKAAPAKAPPGGR
jgi:shikimate kinase